MTKSSKSPPVYLQISLCRFHLERISRASTEKLFHYAWAVVSRYIWDSQVCCGRWSDNPRIYGGGDGPFSVDTTLHEAHVEVHFRVCARQYGNILLKTAHGQANTRLNDLTARARERIQYMNWEIKLYTMIIRTFKPISTSLILMTWNKISKKKDFIFL